MIWETSVSEVARKFGVSNVAVAKWCKSYGIPKPPRGYFAKEHQFKNDLGQPLNSKEVVKYKEEEIEKNYTDSILILVVAQPESSDRSSKTTDELKQLGNKDVERGACFHCGKQLIGPNQDTYCSEQCFRLVSRRVVRPSKEELEKMIWTKPTTQIAKDFGVSDKAVEKWCKAYGIEKPPRGYWAKKQHSKLEML